MLTAARSLTFSLFGAALIAAALLFDIGTLRRLSTGVSSPPEDKPRARRGETNDDADALIQKSTTPTTDQTRVSEWEEEVPNDKSSYLGFDTIPWGSCFEPHTYFRPEPATTEIHRPIVNLGFPKAGTSSLQGFLDCASGDADTYNVSHQFCLYQPLITNNRYQKRGDYCGRCLTQAATNATFAAGQHNPLHRCGNYDAYTQLDMTSGKARCYWPQIDLLDEIHHASPNATFIFTMRDFDSWYTSLSNWHQYDLRIANCRLGAYPDGVLGSLDERFDGSGKRRRIRAAVRKFYCEHVERVRSFVLKHPSHTLVEIKVGDDNIGKYLSELFEADESCWGAHNVNPSSTTLGSLNNSTNNMTVVISKAALGKARNTVRRRRKQGAVGRKMRVKDKKRENKEGAKIDRG